MTINDNGPTTYLNSVGSYPPLVRLREKFVIFEFSFILSISDRGIVEIVWYTK